MPLGRRVCQETEHYPIAVPSFAKVIEERLSEKKMQKQALANMIGVSASRISDFLSGKAEPSLSPARSICQALHIEPRIALQMWIPLQKYSIPSGEEVFMLPLFCHYTNLIK